MDEIKKRMAESVVRGVCKTSPSSTPDMIFLSVRSNSMLSDLSDDELRQIVNDVYAKVHKDSPKQDEQKQDDLVDKVGKEADDFLRRKEEQKRKEEEARKRETERLAELERKRKEEEERRQNDAKLVDKIFDKTGSLKDVEDALKEKGYSDAVIQLLTQQVKKDRTILSVGERKSVSDPLRKRYEQGDFNELPTVEDWYDYVKGSKLGGKKRTKRDLIPILEELYDDLQQRKAEAARRAQEEEDFRRRQQELAEQRARERREREEAEASANNVDLNEETNVDAVNDIDDAADVADVADITYGGTGPEPPEEVTPDLDTSGWKEQKERSNQFGSYYEIYKKNKSVTPFIERTGYIDPEKDPGNYRTGAGHYDIEGREYGRLGDKEKYIKLLNAGLPDDVARSFAEQGLDVSEWWASMRDTPTSRADFMAYVRRELDSNGKAGLFTDFGRHKDRFIPETGKRLTWQDSLDFARVNNYAENLDLINKKIEEPKGFFGRRARQKEYEKELERQKDAADENKKIEKFLNPLFGKLGLSFDENTIKRASEFYRRSRSRIDNIHNQPITISTGDIDFIKSGKPFDEEKESAPAPVETPAPIELPIETTNAPTPPAPIDSGLRPLNLSNVLSDTTFKTPEGSSAGAEANHAATQGLGETILAQRPFANDWYLGQKAGKLGIGNNLSWKHWFKPLRQAINDNTGAGFFPKDVQDLATAGYVLDDFIKMSPSERIENRGTLETLGLVGRIEDSGAVGAFTQLNPVSAFNKKRKAEQKELRRIEEMLKNGGGSVFDDDGNDITDEVTEQLDVFKKRQLDYRKGIDPDKKRVATEMDIDSDFVSKAKEYFDAIKKVFNFSTGQISGGGIGALPKEVQEFLDKIKRQSPNPESYIYNRNETSGERERRERRRRESTGFDFLDQMFARGAKWTRKGQTLGGIFDKFSGTGAGGPFGAGLGKLLGSIGLVVGAIAGLIGIGKKLYAAAQKSIQVTWELVSYNGRLGATKAQYEGQEFSRKQIFAADTEDSRVELVNAQNDLLNSTTKLRAEFAKAGLWIQTKFLRALQWITDKLGLTDAEDYSERDEVDIVKDKLDANSENQRATENEISAQGKLARRYFEYGEFDSELAKQAGFEDPEEARLKLNDKGYRNFWEDAIAFNDVRNGKDFYQGYKGFGVTDTEFTSTSQIQEQILSALENGNLSRLEQLKKSEEILKADLEIARNTSKDINVVSQPIFKAMEMMANKYAVKGTEKGFADGEYSHTFGAKQEKRYGRFASASQQGGRKEE